jgi:uncharacterized OsmC-like protein
MHLARASLLLLALISCGAVHAQKYQTKNGCDEARWKEWESIIIEADGFPDEQEDARGVRDFNRKICGEMDAGRLTEVEGNRRYDEEVQRWVKRVEQRQLKRSKPPGSPTTG